MDSTILSSLIQALGGIIATLISVWIGSTRPGGAPSKIRTSMVILLPIIPVVAFAIGAYYLWIQPKSLPFAPAFGAARLEATASNAHIEVANEVQTPGAPPDVPTYELKSNNIIHIGTTFKPNIKGYLFYRSTLRDKSLGFTFASIIPQRHSNFAGNRGIFLIIQVAYEDKIELSLKDTSNYERKPMLEVKQGWGAYKIPFSEFEDIATERIAYFHIGHNNKGANPSNEFKIGLIELF